MNEKELNIKELVNVRFQNQKFVYDGRRMRSLTSRKVVDYSSTLIYEHNPYKHLLNSIYRRNNTHAVLGLPSTTTNRDASYVIHSKFAHLSVNKAKCPVYTLCWTPDGRRAISGTGTGEFTLWNGFSFNFETILQAHENAVRSLQYAPNSRFLLSTDARGTIKYWHPSMSNMKEFQGHTEAVRDTCFSHDGVFFCSASDDGTLKVWDTAESLCTAVLKGHGWDVRCCQWHPFMSLIVSGGKDNLLKMWDVRQKKNTATLHIHKNTILCLKIKKNFPYAFVSGGKDQLLKHTDIRTHKTFTTYKSHKKEVCSLAFHPASDVFCSGGAEGRIYFWKMGVAEALYTVDAHDNTVWDLEYHPIGHVLASGSVDNSVRFWIRDRSVQKSVEVKKPAQTLRKNAPGLRTSNKNHRI